MWFKHCYGVITFHFVVFLLKKTAVGQPHVSISVVGLLLAYLHSTAWVGLTMKDQYGIYHFRSFRVYVTVSHRIHPAGRLGHLWQKIEYTHFSRHDYTTELADGAPDSEALMGQNCKFKKKTL